MPVGQRRLGICFGYTRASNTHLAVEDDLQDETYPAGKPFSFISGAVKLYRRGG